VFGARGDEQRALDLAHHLFGAENVPRKSQLRHVARRAHEVRPGGAAVRPPDQRVDAVQTRQPPNEFANEAVERRG
jgi:hypothetical protein